MEMNKSLKGNFGLYYDPIVEKHILAVIKERINLDDAIIENTDNQILEMKVAAQYDRIDDIPYLFYPIKKENKNRYN